MPSISDISSGLPVFVQRFGQLIGLSEDVEVNKQPYHWVEDLKLGCLIVSSLAVVVKTIVALAGKIMTLLQGLFWLSAAICVTSLAINACLILASAEERNQLKEMALGAISTVRNYLWQLLCSQD